MAQNLALDPILRDYIVPNGSPIPDDSVYPRAYYGLSIPRNNWLFGSEYVGSDLFLFQNTKRLNSTDALYASRATQAITDQLIASGNAVETLVTNLQDTPDGTLNQIAIQPAQQTLSSVLAFNPV
jgi:hypothetical protein